MDVKDSPTIHAGFDISQRVCLVTGGTSGIGRTIALGFAAAGANVVAASSDGAKVAAMRDQLRERGSAHDALQMDVASEDSVMAGMERIAGRFGRLDVVVHAAGVMSRGRAIDIPVEEFERVVRINLTGSFIVARAAARLMLKQRSAGGSIVLIASLNSFVSLSEVLAYAASKAGVLGLVRGLANEWAEQGIRVNAIAPGVFPTELNRALIEGTARGDWLKQHTPLNRFGRTEELVGTAIYLASPASSFVTGQTLVVDGGFLARGV